VRRPVVLAAVGAWLAVPARKPMERPFVGVPDLTPEEIRRRGDAGQCAMAALVAPRAQRHAEARYADCQQHHGARLDFCCFDDRDCVSSLPADASGNVECKSSLQTRRLRISNTKPRSTAVPQKSSPNQRQETSRGWLIFAANGRLLCGRDDGFLKRPGSSATAIVFGLNHTFPCT